MIDLLLENKIAMEFERHDIGHIHTLEYHLKNRKLQGPLIVQSSYRYPRRHHV